MVNELLRSEAIDDKECREIEERKRKRLGCKSEEICTCRFAGVG